MSLVVDVAEDVAADLVKCDNIHRKDGVDDQIQRCLI